MNTLKQTFKVAAIILLAGFFVLAANSAWANETGLPPNMTKITGQEDFIHIDRGRESELGKVWESCEFSVRRGAKRGTPYGVYHGPTISVGCHTGHEQDIYL